MSSTGAQPEGQSAEHVEQAKYTNPLARRLDELEAVDRQRARLLAKLDLWYVADLLFFFPRDYLDLSNERTIDKLEEGETVGVRGEVEEIDMRGTGPGRSMLGVLIHRDERYLRALWFNQPWMRDKFSRGDAVLLHGKVKLSGGRWEMTHPRVEKLETVDQALVSQLQPIYPLTEGMTQHHMRRAAQEAITETVGVVEEAFSPELCARYDLLPIQEALSKIHFPANQQELAAARRRLIFQELLILQLGLSLRRRQQHDLRRAPALPADAKIEARIQRLLPFELTEAQREAIREITADMALELPMNRLLQGDVGSGKTVVALYAMMVSIAHGYQSVLMAPTEVLARQHFQTLSRLLEKSRVRCALLTGAQTGRQREELLAQIESGEVDLVIGTQAIVLSGCQFTRLGLVVIDEQHKFGVRQRSALRQAGLDPHYLVMTATPIPRSVTMAFFGDLDVSLMRGMPPGRQPVHTYLVTDDKQSRWWDFVRKKLDEGRQAFIVAPLVGEEETSDNGDADDAATENHALDVDTEDGDMMVDDSIDEAFEGEDSTADLQSALEAHARLADGPLADYQLGLVHGRMKPEEKEAVMSQFRDGKIQALVSTSVIEVGVDIPNATVITILRAERFGLAQLHQLRGRVGRGKFAGCGIQANPQTPSAEARLNKFVETDDGFELAETDFQLRGAGDLFGTRQHGMPKMHIADLAGDVELHQLARQAARELVAEDPGLARPEHARLRRMVLVRYGQAMELGDVG